MKLYFVLIYDLQSIGSEKVAFFKVWSACLQGKISFYFISRTLVASECFFVQMEYSIKQEA